MTRHRWKTNEGDQGQRVPDVITDLSEAHRWARSGKADIDYFAGVEVDPHNGPLCLDCGLAECWHCEPEMLIEECPGDCESSPVHNDSMTEGH